MKCVVKKVDRYQLAPAYEHDANLMEKMRVGSMYRADFKKARNPEHHRKGFALVNLIFENQEKYDNLEDLRNELKMQCGSYHHHVRMNGEVVFIPKSWSFEQMDQLAFEKLYDKLIDVAINEWGLREAVEFLS